MKKSSFNFQARARTLQHVASGFAVAALVASASLPVFASPACDPLVGEYAKSESGEVWMRIEKSGAKYKVSTKGAILTSDSDKTGKWDDKPAIELEEIPRDRLVTFKELNENKPVPADLCALQSSSKVMILRVPVGYRFGEDSEDVSKTGYVLAVDAGAYGVGTRDLYRLK